MLVELQMPFPYKIRVSGAARAECNGVYKRGRYFWSPKRDSTHDIRLELSESLYGKPCWCGPERHPEEEGGLEDNSVLAILRGEPEPRPADWLEARWNPTRTDDHYYRICTSLYTVQCHVVQVRLRVTVPPLM